MKNEIVVSIIVPVYNVEGYLVRCIKSVIEQSYTSLEIWLVDDGSTDRSGKICDEFSYKDERIHVIHKENSGLSEARNTALRYVSGEYLTFIDSDDWVHKDYILVLLSTLLENDADIAICKCKNVHILVADSNIDRKKIFIMNKENAISNLLYQKLFTTSAYAKLYKTKFFLNISFPRGKIYEDVVTIFKVFEKTEKIVFCDLILYYYFQREDSIVRKKFSAKNFDYVDNARLLLKRVIKYYPKFKNAAISRLVWADIHVLIHLDNIELYRIEYDAIWNEIRAYRKIVLCDRNCCLKNKCVAFLTYGGDKLLKTIFFAING